MREQTNRATLTVLIPIYNDWDSLRLLLRELDSVLAPRHLLHLVFVDDASTQLRPQNLFDQEFDAFASTTCLRLKCNIGHQRAIATGLAWIGATTKPHPVVIMDGDGEDKPSDIPRLFDRFMQQGGATAVFAERTRRSESLVFKQFYRLYRWMHRIMVGLPVKIGNFSIIPFHYVEGLTVSNYLWYHYAATVVRTRMPYVAIPTSRGDRYRGMSQMNFVSLVRHGVSAIAVHAEVLSVRLLIASFVFTLLGLSALAAVVWIRFFTTLAIPGWATTVTGLILLLLFQVLSLAFTFSVQSVSTHGNTGFLPARDCSIFIREVVPLSVSKYARLVDAG